MSNVNQIAKDLLALSLDIENSSRQVAATSSFGSSAATNYVANAGNSNSSVLNNNNNQLSGSNAGNRSTGTISTASYLLGGGASGTSSGYLSQIEQNILRAVNPIEVNETEELTINGERGLWINKAEVARWKGDVPISYYAINQDDNPEVVTKRSQNTLEYVQELAIRYLRPPTPPAPGEIIINQEPNKITPPAPPIIIRQQPARPDTPEPLVVREAPPQPPAQVGRKVITISGKKLPPPPRKVIIERLAPLPSKPQSVIIERWLPYSEVKRRVIFNRNTQPDPVVVHPKNVIVQWEAPRVNIRKEFKYLGVIRANPVDYVQRYGQSLVASNDLPTFIQDIKTPDGLVLAADYKSSGIHELEGDVEALKLIDLEKEGLGQYKAYMSRLLGIGTGDNSSAFSSNAISNLNLGTLSSGLYGTASSTYSSGSNISSNSQLETLIESLFKQVDTNSTGKISINDAQSLVLRLNSRLGRSYGEDDVKTFFTVLDSNGDGSLNYDEFRNAFLRLAI